MSIGTIILIVVIAAPFAVLAGIYVYGLWHRSFYAGHSNVFYGRRRGIWTGLPGRWW